jgi:tRNA(Ile)-lysidine synthase
MRRNGMVRPGDCVGVAVSGGADSVALLRLLLDLRETLGIVLCIVHFNHQLRGKASDGDEKFVARLAANYELPFFVDRENVAAKARREKANLEDAARRARYGFFARLVEERPVTRVAVAHTADDQAETVLAHILRGTGLAGLGGIHPVSGHIIRPLLQIRRAALRAYLTERKQTWREDATNRNTAKTRAKIRRKLIPLLERDFQPAVVDHLATLAEAARNDEACLEALAKHREASIVEKIDNEARVKTKDLLWRPSARHQAAGNTAIRNRVVRRIVADLKQRSGQLNAPHVRAILELAERGENGRSLALPGRVEVRREHDALVFRSTAQPFGQETSTRQAREFAHRVELSGRESFVEVPCLACVFRFTMIDWPARREETTIIGPVLDRHALHAPLVLRSWLPGDRLHPWGHRKPHKLKRLLNQKRVSRWEREGWPVLTSAGVVVWARGFPVAADFAANEGTRVGILIAEEKIQ